MTFLLALFLAFAKRRDDVNILLSEGVESRKNVYRYNRRHAHPKRQFRTVYPVLSRQLAFLLRLCSVRSSVYYYDNQFSFCFES
jgi:hypothetical protein